MAALEDEERDDALPRLEHADSNGAVDVDDPRALQHLAAGEHLALAQDPAVEVVRREDSAALVAARIRGEPPFPARTVGGQGSSIARWRKVAHRQG